MQLGGFRVQARDLDEGIDGLVGLLLVVQVLFGERDARIQRALAVGDAVKLLVARPEALENFTCFAGAGWMWTSP